VLEKTENQTSKNLKEGGKKMRNSKMLVVGIGLLLLGALVYVGQAQAGIAGTAHDLSTKSYGSTQICIFCHAPHNASTTLTVPLWNHASTAATFTMYSSSTLNATGLAAGPTSKACLSCHDGTVAIDSYGTRTGTNMMTGPSLVGNDLSNDHPIGFTYDSALATADGGLATPADATKVVTGIPLYGGKLECASCHNVHEYGTGSTQPFLRSTNAGSALCLKCHTK
jgi:predicted CXXCH cytochrome family protein